MHLIVPFAAPLSDEGRAAARAMKLPVLARLLRLLDAKAPDLADEWTLSPPHERALARVLGWRGGDGLLPWAARQASADGLSVGTQAWGLLTPAHWHLGTEQISLMDPTALQLDDAQSRAVMQAVQDLFESEGYRLEWGAALRWYAAHESLAQLPTASLDRVVGRNVDRWLGSDPAARRLRRLQSEVQMRLHEHPINLERSARGLLPVNSFWFSGCGVLQTERPVPGLQLDDRLRAPALAEDWTAWAQGWQRLDATALTDLEAALGREQEVTFTLCGERAALEWTGKAPTAWRRLRARWAGADWPEVMESL